MKNSQALSLRLARALVRLQWRMAVNRLTRASHRDDLEQMSRWGEATLRVVAAALLLPAAALVGAAAALAGFAAARGSVEVEGIALAVGFALAVPPVWMVVRPIAMLGIGGIERGVLLRLLPIPADLLRGAEVARVAIDPAFALFVPALLLLPAGALAGGAPALAAATLAAGVLYLAATALLGALVSLAAQLLLRGRRRAELVTLIFLVVLSTASILPQVFLPHGRPRAAGRAAAEAPPPAAAPGTAEPGVRRAPGTPGAAAEISEEDAVARLRALPPAAYAATLLDAAAGRWARLALDLGVLAAWALALHLVAIPVWSRLVSEPEGGSRRRGATADSRRLRLPLVAPATAAVAAAELRALLRTVRGKMALFYPAMMTMMLWAVFASGADTGRLPTGPGLLGAIAVLGAIGSVGVFACNQFATQGTGLVLALLLPLGERRLAAGKALGVGALAATGLALALLPPALLARGESPAFWIALWLAGVAAYAAASPVGVVVSAIFPKPVELSRIGRAGQPNPLASLLYLLAAAVGAAPAAAALALAPRLLGSPWAAPALVGAYTLLAIAAARLILPLAARIATARRENLALVVSGR